jgi:hypothetical protein
MTERPPVDTDDLAPWADDDLVRALRAPGTATELADQERYVAAFRETRGSTVRSLPRRAAGRLGAGGTAVVVTVALTSGVAAAYTGRLPDPVQQIAHSVIGAPAPDVDGRQHAEGSGPEHRSGTLPSRGPSASSSTKPSDAPSSGSTSATNGPAATTTPDHGPRGTSPSSGNGPTDEPSSGTTSQLTTSNGASASAMTVSAPAHRVDLGQTLALTGLVTDETGSPLADHSAVLQVRGPRHWRLVVKTTTDAAGVVSAVSPAITRNARFRWHADRGVSSAPWRVRMVPSLTVAADVGATTTTISLATAGTRPGDRFLLYRHVAGRTALVRRGRLDASGSGAVAVNTPRRRATYAVRLLPTKRHAATRARVLVVPPAPASLTIAGSATRVVAGGTAAIGGTVTSASGGALPGHRVVLLRRGHDRWRPVGRAVTDAAGHVVIATPAITVTSRFRLRTDHRVASARWRVVEVPTLTASADRSGSTVMVSATARGAHVGDRVVLLRRTAAGPVRLRHGRLDASGSLTFNVLARAARTTYVVKLAATQRHGAATTTVTVPGAG